MKKIIVLISIVFTLPALSQEPSVKYGKIAAADFAKASYSIDTSAEAVVLYDYGITKVKGNVKGWFSLEFRMHRRIHILNRNGYSYATLEIPLYTVNEDEEKLDDLRGVTYNLENGKVVESKLEKSNIFKEKKNKNLVIKKFTLPNVKEGSIIEFEYKITSDFLFNLQPWNFQSKIPKLWSEYTTILPQFLNYILLTQGSQPFYMKDRKDKVGDFHVEVKKDGPYGMSLDNDRINVRCGITEFRWVMKDVPALREEAFTTTLDNYISRLEFQLSGYQAPLQEQKVLPDWQALADRLLKIEDFGQQLENTNFWIPDVVQPLLAGASTETEKAKRLFTYVRDRITCTNHDQKYTDQPIRTVLKNNNGNVAEINLLLTAMLRNAGIKADPVILSTRGNGFAYAQYPLVGRFNYVIVQAKIDGRDVVLDASHPQLGFGKLKYDCYNGVARVINTPSTELNLKADQLLEMGTVTVDMTHTKGIGWAGKVEQAQGYYKSMETRRKVKEQGKEGFFKEMGRSYGNDITIEQPRIDSLDMYEEPVIIKYNIKLASEQADIMYVNPMLIERYKQNPFKSANRQYPVEVPYKISDSYILNITVPEGYVVDELPKPLTLKLDEAGNVFYIYEISQKGNTITLNSKLQLTKTDFHPSTYDSLREFFNRVVAKQNEQIVFKKKQ